MKQRINITLNDVKSGDVWHGLTVQKITPHGDVDFTDGGYVSPSAFKAMLDADSYIEREAQPIVIEGVARYERCMLTVSTHDYEYQVGAPGLKTQPKGLNEIPEGTKVRITVEVIE